MQLEAPRSQADVIRDYIKRGFKPTDIITVTGFKKHRVYEVSSEYRRSGAPIPRPPVGRTKTFNINFSACDAERLEEHAARRGITVSRLIARIARVSVRANLIDAVLDDREQK